MNPNRTETLFPSLNEYLGDDPLQEEIRDKLRDIVGRGFNPAVVAEAALVVSSALMLDVEGLQRTAFRLVAAGQALSNAPPEVRGEVRPGSH